MDYKKIYKDLIENAKNRKKHSEDEYYEIHHIIPKCMGGSNHRDNLVKLTAREHFVAHALLVKCYPNHFGVANAMFWMKADRLGKRYFNSHLYELLKKKTNHLRSGKNHHMYGNTHSDKARKKISDAKKGTVSVVDKDGNGFCVSVTDPRFLSGEFQHHSKGRKLTQEHRKKLKGLQSGFNNPNANSITDEEIINHAVCFCKKNNGLWIRKDWILYCKENNIPIVYSKMRFNGTGYNGIIDILSKKVSNFRKITQKDYAKKISIGLSSKKQKWYYNIKTGENKLTSDIITHPDWKPGRKLK